MKKPDSELILTYINKENEEEIVNSARNILYLKCEEKQHMLKYLLNVNAFSNNLESSVSAKYTNSKKPPIMSNSQETHVVKIMTAK